jgi:hypothetical protein
MNAIDHVTGITEGGSSTTMLQWSMALTNNLRNKPEIASVGPIGLGKGGLSITGSVQLYFSAVALYEKYLNFTETDTTITFQDADGNSYVVNIPAIKFTNGRVVAGGKNQDVVANLDWTAKMDDSDTDKMIRITRSAGS